MAQMREIARLELMLEERREKQSRLDNGGPDGPAMD